MNRVALVRGGAPCERAPCVLSWKKVSDGRPESVDSRRREAHASQTMQTAWYEDRLGNLAFLTQASRPYCVLRLFLPYPPDAQNLSV